MTRTLAFLLLALPLSPATRAAERFRLVAGDRVVLIGGTLVEREQKYGTWETALTARFPGVTFRNLGWSGDTVFGEARASFDPPAVGYKRLVEGTLSLKPTVLLVAYGANESFEGAARLPRFVKGLEKLLDDLAPAKARVVLLAPPCHEDLGHPLPDPAARNRDLRLYGEAVGAVAAKRGHGFVNLYDLFEEAREAAPLTDNGMHLTAYGYWRSAGSLTTGLGVRKRDWGVDIDKGEASACGNVRVAGLRAAPLHFDVTETFLPPPPAPRGSPAAALPDVERELCVKGLPEGKYELRIDGKPVVVATAKEWGEGVMLTKGPEFEQAERLRAKIVEKNREYFYRWRPQNETYLFGFRKHEQGQNAREVPLFEPLVAELEKEIAKLRVPATHRYELVSPK